MPEARTSLRIAAVVHPGSGGGTGGEALARVRTALAERDPEADVRVVGDDGPLPDLARRAADGRADLVVAAGGDGTISAVAGALAGSATALGIVPAGTLNHFATDLGIPEEIDDAIATALDGREVEVDVGEVNGRVFVNNSSLGLYPRIVEERLRQQKVGHGKWPALLWATLKVVFRRHPHLHVRIEADGREFEATTQFVFVGNNEYRLTATELGDRPGITDGRLSIFASERSGRLELLALVARAAVGALETAPAFREFTATELTIDTRRDRIRVALDGEVERMEPPLAYAIRPRALRVRVPEGRA